jgi:hypothetical protein
MHHHLVELPEDLAPVGPIPLPDNEALDERAYVYHISQIISS